MKKQLLLCVCLLIALFGCAKDDSFSPESNSTKTKQALEPVGKILSLDEIRSLAVQLPTIYSTRLLTRSASKQIDKIVPFQSTIWGNNVQTRTVTNMTGNSSIVDDLYIVNYKNKAGFSIISADNRIPRVLAYSDEGNLNEDANLPDGVKLFLSALPEYVQQEAVHMDSLLATYSEDLPFDSMPDPDGYYRMNFRWAWGPIEYFTTEPVIKTKWGQSDPFNRYTPTFEGVHAPAGCVAVAIAQITSYHRIPEYATPSVTFRLDWATISNTEYGWQFADAANGINYIGLYLKWIGDLCNMNYGATASGATDNNARGALQTLGYNTSSVLNYDLNALCRQMSNVPRPAYMSGRKPDNSSGHAWIADGYKSEEQQLFRTADLYDIYMNYVGTETVYDGVSSHKNTHIYCNWGWDGLYNGFFIAGAFQPGTSNYTRNVKMIVDISPK